MLATFSSLFLEVYHFAPRNIGLAYLGPGIGYIAASVFGARISDKLYSAVGAIFNKFLLC
jgi:predicted MFS family arabinose efflux permease